MRHIYILTVFLLTFLHVFSQKEGDNWFFGINAALNFSSSPATSFSGGALSATAGCSSISNAQGNLLFYTDGVTIWNQNHNVMANGTGLSGSNCAQSSVVAQKPGSSNLYYVFTVNGGGNAPGLCYSIVDMTLAAGLGSVTVKNSTLYASPLAEKLCATRHCNQTDVWVMTHELGSSNFRAYLLTAAGIGTTAVVSTIGAYHANSSIFGSMKFSPNGKKLGSLYSVPTGTSYAITSYSVELFSFNNFSGTVTPYNVNNTLISSGSSPLGNNWAYGVEFSPNSSKFYFNYFNQVGQADLCGSNWNFNVATSDPSESNASVGIYKGAMQLGIDGRIYIARPTASVLAVINSPNLLSASINYSASGLTLVSGACRWGLPNFVSSYFEQMPGPYSHTILPAPNCKVVAFNAPTVCAVSGYTVSGLQWNFGDPASGSANTSSLSAVSHTFSSPGTYTVKLISSYYCNKNDTLTKVISISTPSFAAISSSPNCATGNVTISATGASGPVSYSWMPGTLSGSVVNNLSAGNYTVNYSDVNSGCAGSFTTQVTAVTVTASASAPKCYLGTNGSATIVAANGSNTFSYTWSGSSQTGTVASNLSAGIYTVTVQNLNNTLCTITKTVAVPQAIPLNLVLATSAASVCAGATVVLSSNVSGGTLPITGQWLGGWQTISTLNTPGVNVFTYYAVDANNCIATATCSILVEPIPTLTILGNTNVCLGQSATLTASGASQYLWNPGFMVTNTLLINPLVSSTYTVLGTNTLCSSTKTILVTVSPTLSAGATAPATLCSGQPLMLSGSGNGSFNWSGPSGFTSTVQNASISAVQPANAGTYTLLVTASGSCSAQANVSVSVFVSPVISISGNTLYCFGQTATITASGAGTYSWNTGNISNVITPVLLNNTTFTVVGTNAAGGCKTSAIFTASVTDCTSLNQQLSNTGNINIYPNPAHTELYFEKQDASPYEVQIYNSLGQSVLTRKGCYGLEKLDVSHLTSAMYYYLVISSDGKQAGKFIKE